METALLLARWGYTSNYGHAERMLRARLLPSQLRDVSWIEEQANPDNVDWLRNYPQRATGSWGCPAPYGHQLANGHVGHFNLDVVGIGSTRLERLVNGYLYIEPSPTGTVTIKFPLARTALTSAYRGRDVRVRLLGDSVEKMDTFGADVTFFDALNQRSWLAGVIADSTLPHLWPTGSSSG